METGQSLLCFQNGLCLVPGGVYISVLSVKLHTPVYTNHWCTFMYLVKKCHKETQCTVDLNEILIRPPSPLPHQG